MALVKALLKPVKAATLDSDGAVIFQPLCLYQIRWLQCGNGWEDKISLMTQLHFWKTRLKIFRASFESFLYLQDIGSKAILSTQLGICAITCVSMKIILKMINGHECRRLCSCNMILPLTQILFFCAFWFHICSDDCARGLLHNCWKTEAMQVRSKAEEESSRSSGEFWVLASGKWPSWCFHLVKCLIFGEEALLTWLFTLLEMILHIAGNVMQWWQKRRDLV